LSICFHGAKIRKSGLKLAILFFEAKDSVIFVVHFPAFRCNLFYKKGFPLQSGLDGNP